MKLKPLSEQTLVITGATSGIGLVTARRAAARGARLVLVARNGEALERLSRSLAAQGCDNAHVAADVADEEALARAAAVAVDRFGGFDTWVNDAGVMLYGKSEQVARADQRRLFETNFWGVVNGSTIAVRHLRQRGGALINVGSEVSDHAAPLIGAYVASKHAVKGFTDTLRIELKHDRAPVSVTLIKPGSIDTPICAHAKNVMDRKPSLPPPVYAPDLVAAAILHAAEHPTRDLYVGAFARVVSSATQFAPRLADRFIANFSFPGMVRDEPPPRSGEDNLERPRSDLRERGGVSPHPLGASLYTQAAMRTSAVPLAALALFSVAAAAWRAR